MTIKDIPYIYVPELDNSAQEQEHKDLWNFKFSVSELVYLSAALIAL